MPKIVPIHYQKLIKIFEMEGFAVARRKGDHISMTKAGVLRPLIIKSSPHEVPVAHIRTNLTTAGMGRQRYFDLLSNI